MARTINLNLNKLQIVKAYLEYFLIDWEIELGDKGRNGEYFLTQNELKALDIVIKGLEKGTIDFNRLGIHQLNFIIDVNSAKEIQYGDYYFNFANGDY